MLYEVITNKAEKLYFETQQIAIQTKGKESDDYAISCNNLGLLYKNMAYNARIKEEKTKYFEKAKNALIVITSYSIHYTKLYELEISSRLPQ